MTLPRARKANEVAFSGAIVWACAWAKLAF
jgi:hypothetical protein